MISIGINYIIWNYMNMLWLMMLNKWLLYLLMMVELRNILGFNFELIIIFKLNLEFINVVKKIIWFFVYRKKFI